MRAVRLLRCAAALGGNGCDCGGDHHHDHHHHHQDQDPPPPPSTEVEKSFLRNVVPFHAKSSGPASVYLRHCYLHQNELIGRVLLALESVPLPSAPRMVLAEGFQRMLEGDCIQRDLRELFSEAYVLSRQVLGAAAEGGKPFGEDRLLQGVRYDPLLRLLAFELAAGCDYYHNLMAITTDPIQGCSVSLRSLVSTDIRTDALLGKVTHSFNDHPRNIHTGERKEPVPAEVEEYIKEMFLLERDVFGVHRFDARSENVFLYHCVKMENMVKTQESFSVLLDPLVKQHGNFSLVSEVVRQGRWTQHTLRAGEEDHRLLSKLPSLETITLEDEVAEGKQMVITAYYDKPLCAHRYRQTTRELKGDLEHVEVFELAIENTNKTFFEKWFMDQY